MGYDLIVSNGIVVDGTGLARRRADVGVRDGRIIDVGHLSESVTGAHVVDADGLFVAPGIIDAHTHYDPQLTFDAWATSSCHWPAGTVEKSLTSESASITATRVAPQCSPAASTSLYSW